MPIQNQESESDDELDWEEVPSHEEERKEENEEDVAMLESDHDCEEAEKTSFWGSGYHTLSSTSFRHLFPS